MLAASERVRWRLFHAPKLTDSTGGSIIAILSRWAADGKLSTVFSFAPIVSGSNGSRSKGFSATGRGRVDFWRTSADSDRNHRAPATKPCSGDS